MKKVKKRLRGLLTAALALSMCMGSMSTMAYADNLEVDAESVESLREEKVEEAASMEGQENMEDSSSIEQEESMEDSSSMEQEESMEDNSSGHEQGDIIDSSSSSAEESTNPDSNASQEQETTIPEEPAQEETLPSIEVTGIFGCHVEDNNGSLIKEWYNESDQCYYMFLTRACNIADLVLHVEGVIVSASSKGDIDRETNSIRGAFASSGDSVSITDASDNLYTVVVMQSDLPSVSITLHNTDLDTVNHNSKDIKYTGNSLVITDRDGSLNLSQENVEFKGRGNTTWALSDKKAYQIKFDKKQKVLGMAKAKKWVLLANAFDDSLMRNSLAFRLADRLGMTFAADFEYVDLWVDGEYRGNYIIGEKNEVNSSRLDLSDPEGVLFEYDNLYYEGEDIWFQTEYTGEYFTVKESVSDNTDDIYAGVASFQKTYNAFIKYICNTDRSAITLDALGRYIDVESAAQYYLITEYLANYESYYTSYYMYQDGENDVIHFGPVWDFDTSQGAYAIDYCAYITLIYRNLLQAPAFSDYVKNYYNQNSNAFSEIQNDIASMKEEILSSANMNYIRWNWLGQENQKPAGLPFEASYEDAVQALADWHNERRSTFQPATADWKWYIQDGNLVFDIKDEGYTNLQAAVWHKDDMSDLKWITARKSGQTWIGSNALSDLTEKGIYNVHIYDFDAYGNVFIAAAMSTYIDNQIKADIYAEQTSDFRMELRAENASACSSVRFAVWSDVNGQDDLIWYQGTRDQNKNWVADVDLKNHFGSGSYSIHVYAGNQYIGGKICNVSLPKVSVEVDRQQGSNFVTALIENANNYNEIKVAVWGDAKGQNDLKWYTAEGYDGSYTAAVDVANHKETGSYHMHVYGVRGSRWEYLCAANFNIDQINKSQLLCTLSDSNRSLEVSYSSASQNFDSIRAAVWGDTNGQNDLKWYDLNQGKVKIDIANHKETGTYRLHLYGVKNGKYSYITGSTFLVNGFLSSKMTLDKIGSYLTATCANAEDYSNVRFALWNSDNGQDDLKWYYAKYCQGSWIYKADLRNHKGGGKVYVHAYGMKNGKLVYIAGGELAA